MGQVGYRLERQGKGRGSSGRVLCATRLWDSDEGVAMRGGALVLGVGGCRCCLVLFGPFHRDSDLSSCRFIISSTFFAFLSSGSCWFTW